MPTQLLPSRPPAQDVVLLGASNLVLGWPALMNTLRQGSGVPLNIHAAFGMGRSYLKTSAVWFRQLPSILDCGLWEHLPLDSPHSPVVLITDLGNDIVYLFEPDEIAASVRLCIERILTWRSDARIVMTGLPMASIDRIHKLQFLIARTILFPGCRLPYSILRERSYALETLAHKLAAEFGIPLVEPESHWYGQDPIHVLPRYRVSAFTKYFAPLNLATPGQPDENASIRNRVPLPTAAARRLFWQNRIVEQPVFRSPELVVSAW